MKIMMMANDTKFIYKLRREILEELVKEGHQVIVSSQILNFREELEFIGCRLIDIRTGRRSKNPLSDIVLFGKYLHTIRKYKPNLVLTNCIKPNIYGGLACKLLGIKYISNITGLGTAVEYPGKLQTLTTRLYKWGVSAAACVFFQNEENEQFFRNNKMLSKHSRTRLLPGSGVNIEDHCILPYPEVDVTNFLFVARIMKEKGIDLYLAAAKAIWKKYGNVMFHICGMCDDEKYIDILKQAEASGYVKYHGEQKDMVRFFEMAHSIVHPSYYPEGMSNVLLEAAASARPIITTDRSGCRETVNDGVSGFVIPIKDETALIGALDRFMCMRWEQRRDMGMAGRRKMEREFDRRFVVQVYIEEINDLS